MMTEIETRLLGLFKHYVEDSATRDKTLVVHLNDVIAHLERLETLCQRLINELGESSRSAPPTQSD